jgi:molecular chaperone DnaK
MKGDDKDTIEAKTKALVEASGKMAERAYAQQAEAGQAEGAAGAGAEANTANDDIVDAEFEEVKDDNK